MSGKGDSKVFKYIELSLVGCDLPAGECADSSEVDNTYINFFQTSSKADFADFRDENVLKISNSEKNLIVLDSAIEQKINMFYTKSHIILDDSPWKLFGAFKTIAEIYEFVTYYKYYEKVDPEAPTEEKTYYKMYMRADTSANQYSRVTHGLLEYIGILRGLYSIINVIVFYSVNNFI